MLEGRRAAGSKPHTRLRRRESHHKHCTLSSIVTVLCAPEWHAGVVAPPCLVTTGGQQKKEKSRSKVKSCAKPATQPAAGTSVMGAKATAKKENKTQVKGEKQCKNQTHTPSCTTSTTTACTVAVLVAQYSTTLPQWHLWGMQWGGSTAHDAAHDLFCTRLGFYTRIELYECTVTRPCRHWSRQSCNE